jgi:prevent-host-death family protein
MVEVGVKELKNELSAYLRRVANGEQVRVTMRGKPIADLVPPAPAAEPDRIDALIAAGRITPASRPKPSKSQPPAPAGPGPTLSEIILAEREEDR